MRTAFDQALEHRAIFEASKSYALDRGSPGSPEFRAAWLSFRSRIRTVDDLERWRTYQRFRVRTTPSGTGVMSHRR